MRPSTLQTSDSEAMMLNTALFEINGSCGYVAISILCLVIVVSGLHGCIWRSSLSRLRQLHASASSSHGVHGVVIMVRRVVVGPHSLAGLLMQARAGTCCSRRSSGYLRVRVFPMLPTGTAR